MMAGDLRVLDYNELLGHVLRAAPSARPETRFEGCRQ
jgi:hypothetical protein